MKYNVRLSKKVIKFLGKHRELKDVFMVKLDLLTIGETKTLDIRPLQGGKKNRYRLRIGDYRFLYELRETEIIIYFYDAGSRGDIYK